MNDQIFALTPRPDHIPESLVYDFDLFQDPALLENPSARLLDLVKNAPPVFWTPRYGGRWFITSHAAISEGVKAIETFSNVIQSREALEAAMPPGAPLPPNPAPVGMDPPEHGIYRTALTPYFSPRSMMALTDKIRQLAVELIDAIKGKGEAEFVSAVATPLPVNTFLALLGLSVDRRQEYLELMEEPFDFGDPSVDNMPIRLQQIAAALRPVILERKDNPKDDIISAIWQADFGGRPATYEDVENLVVVTFIAGMDTVKNAIGFALIHLAQNPDLQKQLREKPTLINTAKEEMLRRYGFTALSRRVLHDTEFQGVTMKANEIAVLFYATGYLDPSVVSEPEKFDLDRKSFNHFAFGHGIHRCLGMHLARIELQVIYEEALTRLPEFRLDPARSPKYHGGNTIGPDEIWLNWDV